MPSFLGRHEWQLNLGYVSMVRPKAMISLEFERVVTCCVECGCTIRGFESEIEKTLG
jgi:hypothetical protein